MGIDFCKQLESNDGELVFPKKGSFLPVGAQEAGNLCVGRYATYYARVRWQCQCKQKFIDPLKFQYRQCASLFARSHIADFTPCG